MRKTLKFLVDRRGVAIVEFALVFPLMITMWVGTIEASNLHLVGRKATVAAQSAADLVAQRTTVSVDSINDIVAAMNAIFAPFPPGAMSYDISSVEANSDSVVDVGWRLTQGSVEGGGQIPAVARQLVSTNDSVIVVNISYVYQPMLGLLFGDITITEEAYARPRKTSIIPLT
jgi:Flp pilus assembly protein TadG